MDALGIPCRVRVVEGARRFASNLNMACYAMVECATEQPLHLGLKYQKRTTGPHTFTSAGASPDGDVYLLAGEHHELGIGCHAWVSCSRAPDEADYDRWFSYVWNALVGFCADICWCDGIEGLQLRRQRLRTRSAAVPQWREAPMSRFYHQDEHVRACGCGALALLSIVSLMVTDFIMGVALSATSCSN